MKSISEVEIRQFWRDVLNFVQRKRTILAQMQDYALLGKLQGLVHTAEDALRTPESLTASVSQTTEAAALIVESAPLDEEAKTISACAHAIADAASVSSALDARHEALAGRLFAMHRYLDGVAGTQNFGLVTLGRDADMKYGLGLDLKDGSLLRFFTRLKAFVGAGAEGFFENYFDEDGAPLLDAVREGQVSLEEFVQRQLILRYDPVMARKIYDVPELWHARFRRLGESPQARKTQVSIVAGDRFEDTRRRAQLTGIQSLRGFAMLFDAGSAADDSDIGKGSESQKCLSLADSVISRLQGHSALHWQQRLSSVFRGYGAVDDRHYDEKQFLGKAAGRMDWQNADFTFDDERDEPEPRSGHTYVVCPGDRLSALAQKAYGRNADCRAVLRRNPQILQPERLTPGMRIYFPEFETESDVQNDVQDKIVEWIVGLDCIRFDGRELGPLSILDENQKDLLFEALKRLSSRAPSRTAAVEIHGRVMVACDRETIFVSTLENRKRAAEIYTQCDNPILVWANRIAAQIRGDVEVCSTVFLPLAVLPSQPNRRRWMADALAKVLADSEAQPCRIAVRARDRCVDIVDVHGSAIVRLENEDFLAIREQPWRRLSDYIAPPIVQMNDLAQLWLSDLFEKGFEIAVPPLSHANQYSFSQEEHDAVFLVPMGMPVYAMMRGTVVSCGRDPDEGCGILIRHGFDIYVKFRHLATVNVHPGQHVEAETVIARSGTGPEYAGTEPMLKLNIYRSAVPMTDWRQTGETALDYFDVVYSLCCGGARFESEMGG